MEKSSCNFSLSAYEGGCQPDVKNLQNQIIDQLVHSVNRKKIEVLKTRIEELGLIVNIDLCINLHLIKVEVKGNEETYIYSDGISDMRIVTFINQCALFDPDDNPNTIRANINYY